MSLPLASHASLHLAHGTFLKKKLAPRTVAWTRLASCALYTSHQTHLAPCAPPSRLAPCAVHAACASCLMPRSCLAPPAPHATLSHAASIRLHWTAASRWAHIATVCFVCFKCMLHMFHLDVAKVDLMLRMLQWLYTCCKCMFSCFKHMLQVFFSKYCICYSGYTCRLQMYVPNVSPILDLCCKCFIWMLHMFQTYVVSVYFRMFHIYFRHML
jgi:hypothetical protein